MKKLFAFTIFIAVFSLCGCEPVATFIQPQPDNVKSLTAFPASIQGDYLAADQASVLTISNALVTRHYDFDFKENRDSLGSSYKILNDTLIYLPNMNREKILVEGDSIVRHANWIDTLFLISPENILKKFKGYYFLNLRFSDNAWEVKKLSLKKGVLTVGSIADKSDINKLKEITETTSDTTTTYFNLTRKQFRIFVRQNGFSQLETFKRMQ